MGLIEVYLGLGGNIGDSQTVLQSAIHRIGKVAGIYSVEVSRFYETSPVGGPQQNFYLNAVCRLNTSLPIQKLFKILQEIEVGLGKVPKPKNSPRVIDIDILFYGMETIDKDELEIPHPRWKERLFVLVPLADLVTVLKIPDRQSAEGFEKINLLEFIDSVAQTHHDTVVLQAKELAI